jgi:tRNA(Ile)-lysidine synthetase-like protein
MKSLELASLAPCKYIVAVSGGVDSMVLLDVLTGQTGLELIVAHFNHGIRDDADEDEQLVRETAATKNLPYIYDKVRLGASASEDAARKARYDFLRRVAKDQHATIITAHHQDDLLETTILNLLRGTGRRGLSSLQSSEVMRPLLDISKEEILAYARAHSLAWREDSTNADERYARNYVRQKIAPRLGAEGRQRLLEIIAQSKMLNDEIEANLGGVLAAQPSANELQRSWFAALPYNVSCEVMAAFLRTHGIRDFTARDIHRLVIAAKTFTPGKRADICRGKTLCITKTSILFSDKA